MKISADISYKQDEVNRNFKTSEIYCIGSPRRYYMVIENNREKFNLLNLETGTTLFQYDMDYNNMNKTLNGFTSEYKLLQECEIVIKGTIKTR